MENVRPNIAIQEEAIDMAKPQIVTDLQLWMIVSKKRDTDIAKEINEFLGDRLERPINERHVARWRKGLQLPRHTEIFEALDHLSNGKVTANSFYKPKLKDF